MIINGTNLAELYTAYSALFSAGFQMADPQWSKVAMEVPSTTRENIYSFLGSAPRMRQWLGPRQAKKIGQHDYRLTNQKFESTVEVERDDLEDNRAASYDMLFKEMGAAAAMHPDELVFPLLTNGVNADAVGYDDEPFFSASHPNGVDGLSTAANLDSGGGGPYWYLMALNMPMKPLIFQKRRDYSFKSFTDLKDPRVWREDMFEFGADARVVGGYGMWQGAYASNQELNETNLESAWTEMRTYTTDEGQPLKFSRPTHLVIPTALEFDALRLVAQDLVLTTAGAGEAAAVNNIHKGRLQIITSEQLPNT